MHVLVTAGGTREPIDAVRVLANRSTGRLGARLVEALLQRGHRVTWLHGVHAVRPAAAAGAGDRLAEVRFDTTAELQAGMRRHAPDHDAVFHAAAVADYLPDSVAGKLSSEADELVLHLRRAPKLVDGLRSLAPEALLCGFKLTAGGPEADRIAAARRLLERAQLDLVLANDAGALEEGDHEAWLLDAAGIRGRARGKPAVAALLVQALESMRPLGAAS